MDVDKNRIRHRPKSRASKNFIKYMGLWVRTMNSFGTLGKKKGLLSLWRFRNNFSSVAKSDFLGVSAFLESNKMKKPGIVSCPSKRNVHLPSAKEIKNKVGDIFNSLFFIKLHNHKLYGLNWYRSMDQVNFNDFYTILSMPDTFFSWFKVTELHVWMILVRLMKNSKELRYVRSSLLEAMWLDVEKRAKLVDPLNKNYKLDLKILEERFKISLFIYDEAYFNNDMMFANALWQHFFEKNCDDPRSVEILISFIRHQLNLLHSVAQLEQNLEQEKLPQVWTSLRSHYKKVISEMN